jgi:hypothetical protein
MNTFITFGKIVQSFISTDWNSQKSSIIAANLPAPVPPSVRIPKKKKRNSVNIFSSLLSYSPQKNNSSFFMKNICAGIHSIEIDNSGYMFVGSLGDNPSEIGKKSLKKIFKISPLGVIDETARIDCQFITAITSDSRGVLYFATLEELKGKVYKINNNRQITEIASGFSEIYSLKVDHRGNLLIGTDKIYLINEKGEKSVFIPDKGVIDFDKDYQNLFMGTIDGNELFRYPVCNSISTGANTFFEGLKGIKCLSVCPNGKIVVLSYDSRDLLTIIDNGKIIKQIQINIDLPKIFLPRRYILTNMAVGKKGFDDYSMYITTWTGDIIKIRTGFNLVSSGTGN